MNTYHAPTKTMDDEEQDVFYDRPDYWRLSWRISNQLLGISSQNSKGKRFSGYQQRKIEVIEVDGDNSLRVVNFATLRDVLI